jgi:hypothetical protein
MNRLGHNSSPLTPSTGRGAVLSEIDSVGPSNLRKVDRETKAHAPRSQKERRDGTNISLQADSVLSDECTRRLIDEWIVPMLVDEFMQSLLVKQSKEEV